jgi:hypothetical protein
MARSTETSSVTVTSTTSEVVFGNGGIVLDFTACTEGWVKTGGLEGMTEGMVAGTGMFEGTGELGDSTVAGSAMIAGGEVDDASS